MNRRIRMRIALTSTIPTLLTLPVICLLAALGAVPWSLLVALPVVLVVQAAVNFSHLDQRLTKTRSDRPASEQT
ncbi:hypothetical protein B4N89_00185 [Embleya scabrispora]|uniref:Uncharacterized protein n=1 Tax=Embleya scabrispora TaxID=159449 RepID=A0A1T3P6W6_9ACTN|nr:hypothetical protein B4N89_00185 [Embleya scabrispora]